MPDFIADELQQAARSLLGTKGPIEALGDAQPFVSLGGQPLIRLPALEQSLAIPRRFFARSTATAVVGDLGFVAIRTASTTGTLLHIQRIFYSSAAALAIGCQTRAGLGFIAFGDALFQDSRLPNQELNGTIVDIGNGSNGVSLFTGAGGLIVPNNARNPIEVDVVLVPAGFTGSLTPGDQAQLIVEAQTANTAFTVSFDGLAYSFPPSR